MQEGTLALEGDGSLKEMYDCFMAEEEVGILRNDFRIIRDFLDELGRGMKGWTKFSESERKKIYYKQEEGVESLTIYLEANINAPLLNLFTIISEVQLFKNFIPLMKQSDIVGEVSPLRKMVYFRQYLPWPLKQRECFLTATGTVLKETNAAVLSMSTTS